MTIHRLLKLQVSLSSSQQLDWMRSPVHFPVVNFSGQGLFPRSDEIDRL